MAELNQQKKKKRKFANIMKRRQRNPQKNNGSFRKIEKNTLRQKKTRRKEPKDASYITSSTLRHKIIKEENRKRRIRNAGISILAVVVFALLGFILWFKTDEGYFNIKHIDVVGNEAVDAQTVSEICKTYENKPIYLISYNNIYRDIRANITTNFVHLYLKLPDTLEVVIEESPVLFCVSQDNNYYYFDDNQKIVEISDNLGKTNVPLFTGVSLNGDLNLKSKPEIKPLNKSTDMLVVLDKIKKEGYLNRISEMNASDDILIRIITKNNLCFKIRTADDFMRHYDYFKLAIDEGQSNIDVDMTTENNVIIKDRNPKNEEDE